PGVRVRPARGQSVLRRVWPVPALPVPGSSGARARDERGPGLCQVPGLRARALGRIKTPPIPEAVSSCQTREVRGTGGSLLGVSVGARFGWLYLRRMTGLGATTGDCGKMEPATRHGVSHII